MKGYSIIHPVILFCIIFLVSNTAMVSADSEPNDYVTNAEEIGRGTHSGSVTYMNSIDWYKVKVGKGEEITIEGSMVNPSGDNYISMLSCDSSGMPDGQTEIYIGIEMERDSCHWKNYGESETYVYIQVQGNGDYKLKIDKKDDGNDVIQVPRICCFGSTVIGLILLTAMLVILTVIRNGRYS